MARGCSTAMRWSGAKGVQHGNSKGVQLRGRKHGNYKGPIKGVQRTCFARFCGTTCEKSSVTPCSTRVRTVRTWLGLGLGLGLGFG